MKRFTERGLSPNCPDAPDGKQSEIDVAFDLLDPDAMFALARVLQEGRRKGRTTEGWKSLPVEDHLNHALMHIFGFMQGDRQEDHLQHAFCRLMMAWSVAHSRSAEAGMRWVYLCYPYKDDPVRRTRDIVRWAQDHYDPGVHFLIPHLSMQYMDEETQRYSIMQRCREAVLRCDELWVIGDDVSDGMVEEIDAAEMNGIPVVRKET